MLTLEEAEELYNAGKVDEARPVFQKLADEGDPKALYALAFLYYYGKGVPEDKSKGLYLWKKAAAKKQADAAMTVGFLYSFSKNKKEQKEGFNYTKQAAEAGLPIAMGNLANCYYYGKGTRKDKRLAKEWYQKASDLGMDTSTMQLGVIYHEEGNDDKAFALFLKAAENGYSEAMGWVAACYNNGYGVQKNQQIAHTWLKRAAAAGSKDAKEALQVVFGESL